MDKILKGILDDFVRSQSRDTFRRDQNLVPRDLKTLNAIDSRLRNLEKEPVMKTIKVDGPNWKMAVRIYCAVLQNPDAKQIAKTNAEADLMELATAMDKINAEKKSC